MWTYKQYRDGFVTLRDSLNRCPGASFLRRHALTVVLACCLVILAPEYATSQRNDILEVKALKTEIKSRFSLSGTDLSRIEPLIDQESRKLIKMYVRFNGDEPEYSPRVWDQVIEDRSGFALSLGSALSKRQREALRSARSRMEKKVLRYLVDDYLNFLAQVLELSDFQSNEVADLLDSECTKKSMLVTARLGDVPRLQKELEYQTDVTELGLKKILTADQWREYVKLREGSLLTA